MNQKEFKGMIDRAANILAHREEKYLGLGVCDILMYSFNETRDYSAGMKSPIFDFQIIFKPKNTKKIFWLGKPIPENKPKRFIALKLFEQYALTNKLYKKY